MTTLPIPHPDAIAHSKKLSELIQREIIQAGGAISFSRFMQMALYEPGLGYYSSGTHKFGREGDFITAPEISPLFAQCIAKYCQPVLCSINDAEALEFGAGSGTFAADFLLMLEKLGCLPKHYFILELSADLRDRQQKLFQTKCPHLLPRIHWLDSLPEKGINGIIFANEVLDAMPVHCFRMEDDGIKERCVSIKNNTLQWRLQSPLSAELTQRIDTIDQECPLPSSYESEINLMLPAWIHTVAHTLKKGIILLFDYGYGRREYYHPDRSTGTLMCFYRHHQHADPFQWPGLQDITAHVDFTAVAESALDAGLQLAGFTTQAGFLLASGILDLASQPTLSTIEQYKQNQAIRQLTLPSQMGEVIKVMALSKDLETPLQGFAQDRRHDL